jgi:hypothetical protein
VDQAAVEFCYLNNKANRKKLVNVSNFLRGTFGLLFLVLVQRISNQIGNSSLLRPPRRCFKSVHEGHWYNVGTKIGHRICAIVFREKSAENRI